MLVFSGISRVFHHIGHFISPGWGLQAAACSGSAKTVKILVDAQADVNAQGGEYGNALQAAAYDESAVTVEILLNAQADVNAQGGEFGNALQAAASRGCDERVKILLNAQADVNAQGGLFGNALQAAATARRGSAETVKILLNAQADVNAQGGKYGNALHPAAATDDSWGGSSEAVRILVDTQADVNAQGGRYGSPLLAAISSGHADCIELLLHAGADISLPDELGQTPLHVAASKDMAYVLYRFPQLVSAINKRNKLQQTPLHLAICFGHIHFAIKLLHLGADPSLPDGYGRHALDWALGHANLSREIREICPRLSLTPHEYQRSTVQQSLVHLSDTLPRLSLNYAWLVVQQLARYFLFLNNTNNARRLFQIRLSQNNSLATHTCQAVCNFCHEPITGTRSVCRACANIDICSSCVLRYPFHHRLNSNEKHEVFEVPEFPDNESQLTGQVSQPLKYFLNRHFYEDLEGNANESVMKLSNDSSSLPSWRKNGLVPNTAFNLKLVFFVILSGLLATFLGFWYL